MMTRQEICRFCVSARYRKSGATKNLLDPKPSKNSSRQEVPRSADCVIRPRHSRPGPAAVEVRISAFSPASMGRKAMRVTLKRLS